MPQCDVLIRETGKGCCPECFEQDTHGLLDKFKVIDVADHAQDTSNLNRLAAQTVIGFSEHAKAIRHLRADVDTMIEQLARIEGMLERAEPGEKRKLMREVMIEVRGVVQDLPERMGQIERALPELEAHVGLRRKEGKWKK